MRCLCLVHNLWCKRASLMISLDFSPYSKSDSTGTLQIYNCRYQFLFYSSLIFPFSSVHLNVPITTLYLLNLYGRKNELRILYLNLSSTALHPYNLVISKLSKHNYSSWHPWCLGILVLYLMTWLVGFYRYWIHWRYILSVANQFILVLYLRETRSKFDSFVVALSLLSITSTLVSSEQI